jgi:hypothetical protein
MISTAIVYIIPHPDIKKLPRDVNTPASVLAFVYRSENLKAFVMQKHNEDQLRRMGQPNWLWRRETDRGKYESIENDLIAMGPFIEKGEDCWGVELYSMETESATRKNV